MDSGLRRTLSRFLNCDHGNDLLRKETAPEPEAVMLGDTTASRSARLRRTHHTQRQQRFKRLGRYTAGSFATVCYFLVNMLEAYYFAHSKAVNMAAGRIVLANDHEGDVETIPHPKNELKALIMGRI
jgi:hypothetical protein